MSTVDPQRAEQLCETARGCADSKDYAQAKRLYNQAHKLDPKCDEALNALGDLYHKGHGMLFGIPWIWAAESYYKQAYKLGNPMASFNLGLIYLKRAIRSWNAVKIRAKEDDFNRASQAFGKAWSYFATASDKISLANYHLGDFELFSLARPINKERAIECYTIAARAGHDCAQKALNNLLMYQAEGGYPFRSLAAHFEWLDHLAAKSDPRRYRGEIGARSTTGYSDGTEGGGGVSYQ